MTTTALWGVIALLLIMGWTGKSIGIVADGAFGPLGAPFGAYLGHCYDSEVDKKDLEAKTAYQKEYQSRMNVFAIGVCAAYADDILHPNERKRLQILARDIFGDISDGDIDGKIREIRNLRLTEEDCARLFVNMLPEGKPAMAIEILSILHADGSEDVWEKNWRDKFTRLMGNDERDWADILFYFQRVPTATTDRHFHLQRLELPADADETAIKASYRRLALEYHPDRLGNVSPKLRKLAEDQLREINLAYESLTKGTAGSKAGLAGLVTRVADDSLSPAEGMQTGEVVQCFLCNQKNRLPMREQMHTARCGRCYALLLQPQ